MSRHPYQHPPELQCSGPRAPRASHMSAAFHVMCCTWNVGAQEAAPSSYLSKWLMPISPPVGFDMYVIGLQEAQSLTGVDAVKTDRSRGDKWINAVCKTVGPKYKLLVGRQLTGIVLIVLVLHKHYPHISSVAASYAATGFLNQGNKGAVAARFVIYNRAVAVVVTHLAAGSSEEDIEKRNSDFRGIVKKAVFSPSDASMSSVEQLENRGVVGGVIGGTGTGSSRRPGDSTDSEALRSSFTSLLNQSPAASTTEKVNRAMETAATVFQNVRTGGDVKALTDPHKISVLDHDLVIWQGDLNYRMNAHSEKVMAWIDDENWQSLASADQLTDQRRTNRSFQQFEEAPIRFPPTYKMDRRKNFYPRNEDGDLKRTPSHTDRVLWKTLPYTGKRPPEVEALEYNSVRNVFGSDHRPVYCLLGVRFGSSSPKSPSAQKLLPFTKEVTDHTMVRKGDTNSVIEFSDDRVDYGNIPHRLNDRKHIVVSNHSNNAANIAVVPKSEGHTIPEWLRIPLKHMVIPAKGTAKIFLDVCLARDKRYRDGFLGEKNLNPAFSTAIYILVKPMHVKHRVDITFSARNSCYAMPLRECILYKTPMALIRPPPPPVESDASSSSSSSASSTSSNDSDRATSTTNSATPLSGVPQTPENVMDELERAPLSVPKEIWTLVDNLVDTRSTGSSPNASVGIPEADIFLQEALPAAWAEVLYAIDNGATQLAYREDSIATCLLQLLAALPEPVLTDDAFTGCCTAMRRRNVQTLIETLQILPHENRNLFYYITAFLGECGRVWGEEDLYHVAKVFSRRTAFLGRLRREQAAGYAYGDTESEREKTDFLLFAVHEYIDGRLVPEMVVDLAGSIIVPVEEERYREDGEKGKKGVKKWKKKTGKRMKKVLQRQQASEVERRRR